MSVTVARCTVQDSTFYNSIEQLIAKEPYQFKPCVVHQSVGTDLHAQSMHTLQRHVNATDLADGDGIHLER